MRRQIRRLAVESGAAVCLSVMAMVVMAAPALASAPGDLTLFAGTGGTGAPIAGPAVDSPVAIPLGVAADGLGDVYVSDYGNVVVDKITPDGALSVFAGDGSNAGPTPGPALSSSVGDPNSLALDATGNLYIADDYNNVIEKVTPSGTLSVVVGNGTQGPPTPGPATSSALSSPQVAAGQSNLYIADPGNNVVEKVTPDGTLSIVAGNGTMGPPTPGPATSSSLSTPNGVAVDSAGNLYIADAGNNVVEKVTPDGTLSIVAGNGTSGLPTPGPATSSPLAAPNSIAVDSAGNLYVADLGNHDYDVDQVLKITPDGALSIIAGSGGYGTPTYGVPATSSQLAAPVAVAVDGYGVVYITDQGSNSVERISPPVPVNTTSATITGTPSVGQTLTADTGTWFPTPTSYAYQWRDCDASGSDCTDIPGATSITYTLATGDAGHTIEVNVTATNESGSATVTSNKTAVVASAPAATGGTTPTTAIPTTTTTPTTTTATTTGAALSERARQNGVAVSGSGGLGLPLICPATASGCDADGNLVLVLGRSSARRDDLLPRAVSVRSSVIARFAGIEIQAGHGRLVSVRLSPAATRYLQTRRIRRVRVSLTIHNHLSGGMSVTTHERLWLNIGPLMVACPGASGRLTASHIGTMSLGLTRPQAHRLGRYRPLARNFERYCLTAGKIRVAYPTAGLAHRLTSTQRKRTRGRVILALTANRHYAIHGIQTRMAVHTARAHLTLRRGITIGLNTWYFVQDHHATWVLKAQHGIIREIGITRRFLADTRGQQTYLLRHL